MHVTHRCREHDLPELLVPLLCSTGSELITAVNFVGDDTRPVICREMRNPTSTPSIPPQQRTDSTQSHQRTTATKTARKLYRTTNLRPKQHHSLKIPRPRVDASANGIATANALAEDAVGSGSPATYPAASIAGSVRLSYSDAYGEVGWIAFEYLLRRV